MTHRPHWSYSSISQYLACPLRFYFQRVLHLPQATVSSNLVLGSAVHAALARYHRSVRDDEPTDTAGLHQIFNATWTKRESEAKVSYRDGTTQDDGKAQGINLIELYLKEPPPQNIIGIEQEILAPIHTSRGEILETPLLAVADLITEDNEELTVREFKTSGRAYSELEVETSLQATCYANAVQDAIGLIPIIEYTVLVKTKTPRIQRLTTVRNDQDRARLGDIVENVERAVDAEIFYPVESPLNCSSCPYRQPCREWGHRTEAESVATAGSVSDRGA